MAATFTVTPNLETLNVELTVEGAVPGSQWHFWNGAFPMSAAHADDAGSLTVYDHIPWLGVPQLYEAWEVGGAYERLSADPVVVPFNAGLGSTLTSGLTDCLSPAVPVPVTARPVVREEETRHVVFDVPGRADPVVVFGAVPLPTYSGWELLVATPDLADDLTHLLRAQSPVVYRTCYEDGFAAVLRRSTRQLTDAGYDSPIRKFTLDLTQCFRGAYYASVWPRVEAPPG